MRRAGMVTMATVAGFAALMSFHTKPATLSLSSLGATTTTRASSGSTNGGSSSSGPTTTGAPTSTTTTPTPRVSTTTAPPVSTSTTPTTSTTRPTPTTTTLPSTTTRTVVGAAVNYNYGTLAVSVTGSASHVTNVSIASISDGGDSRSQSIDQYAIPILESQALSAQSANIQGVSGASYTSAGFEQSLQSALLKLRSS
jgi:uncharacterized protein with FMN-binding domain